MKTSAASELLKYFNELSEDGKREALAFLKHLRDTTSSGVRATKLIDLAGTLDKDSAAEMRAAIAEGCEQVDPNGW